MRRDIDVLLLFVVLFVSIYLYKIFPGVMICLFLLMLSSFVFYVVQRRK